MAPDDDAFVPVLYVGVVDDLLTSDFINVELFHMGHLLFLSSFSLGLLLLILFLLKHLLLVQIVRLRGSLERILGYVGPISLIARLVAHLPAALHRWYRCGDYG